MAVTDREIGLTGALKGTFLELQTRKHLTQILRSHCIIMQPKGFLAIKDSGLHRPKNSTAPLQSVDIIKIAPWQSLLSECN